MGTKIDICREINISGMARPGVTYEMTPSVRPLVRSLGAVAVVMMVVGLVGTFLNIGIELHDLGLTLLVAAGLLYLSEGQSGATRMALLSWGLFIPFAIAFHVITLVSVTQVSDIALGAMNLGFMSLAPWYYYVWAGLSVAITAWFMTAAKLPKWPPRRFIVWPWFTGFFISFLWPTRITTTLLGIDIGDWQLSTGWVDVFRALGLDDLQGLGVNFEFEAISFGEYWGAFFLFWWLLHAFVVWTVFVYARMYRVGKENYTDSGGGY
jgi:hypothetical protein